MQTEDYTRRWEENPGQLQNELPLMLEGKKNFIKMHLQDIFTEFELYRKLNTGLSKEIYFAVNDLIEDAFKNH